MSEDSKRAKGSACSKCPRQHSYRWEGVKYCRAHWGERCNVIRYEKWKERQ